MQFFNNTKVIHTIQNKTYSVWVGECGYDTRPYFLIDNCKLTLECSYTEGYADKRMQKYDHSHDCNTEVLTGEIENVALSTVLIIPYYQGMYRIGEMQLIKLANKTWSYTYEENQ